MYFIPFITVQFPEKKPSLTMGWNINTPDVLYIWNNCNSITEQSFKDCKFTLDLQSGERFGDFTGLHWQAVSWFSQHGLQGVTPLDLIQGGFISSSIESCLRQFADLLGSKGYTLTEARTLLNEKSAYTALCAARWESKQKVVVENRSDIVQIALPADTITVHPNAPLATTAAKKRVSKKENTGVFSATAENNPALSLEPIVELTPSQLQEALLG